MAANVAEPATFLEKSETVFRGLNPKHCPDGEVGHAVFVLRRDHTDEQTPSVGIERLIPVAQFRALFNPTFGVARLPVDAIEEQTQIRVKPYPADERGAFAHAHAILTGYQAFGNKELGEARRFLMKLAQNNIAVAPDPSRSTL